MALPRGQRKNARQASSNLPGAHPIQLTSTHQPTPQSSDNYNTTGPLWETHDHGTYRYSMNKPCVVCTCCPDTSQGHYSDDRDIIQANDNTDLAEILDYNTTDHMSYEFRMEKTLCFMIGALFGILMLACCCGYLFGRRQGRLQEQALRAECPRLRDEILHAKARSTQECFRKRSTQSRP